MIASKEKLSLLKIVGIAFIIPLVSCTTYSRSNLKIRNNTSYLDSVPLVKLKAPEGITLPVKNDIYDIPPIPGGSNTLSKELDISPPE